MEDTEKNNSELNYTEKVKKSDNDIIKLEIEQINEKPGISLENILKSVNDLSEKIDEMNKLFIGKIQHTEYEEKVLDQMHAELKKYKEDLYSQLIRPILLDIIEVRDSIMRISKTYQSKPEGEQDIPNKMFADYALDIQDILEKNDVEIYHSEAGETFVPVKQRAVKKVVTDNEELHGKIVETLANGYRHNDRTISAEKVSVYYYEKNKSQAKVGNV